MSHEILQLPHDIDGARSNVERYKSFRLLSLQVSPEAFSSTYERENAFDDETWLSRLTNPSATSFVALQSDRIISTLTVIENLPQAPEDVSPLENPWLATTEGASGLPPAMLHSRINGMFTLPEARRQGLGQALLERAVKFAGDQAKIAQKDFVMSIAVESDNKAARDLYERCGFVVIKEETIPGRQGDGTRGVLLLKYNP